MDQILVRMTKAKKPTGAKSLQDLPCQARGKGTMKILAMEATNFLSGNGYCWYSQVPCKGFSCRMLYAAPCCVETFLVSLEEICAKDFLEAVLKPVVLLLSETFLILCI
jgi:hypothetical protein